MKPSNSSGLAGAFTALLADGAAQDPRTARERLAQLVELVRPRWNEGSSGAEPRMRTLLDRMRDEPWIADTLRKLLHTVLLSTSHRSLYAESGVIDNEGLVGGLVRRTMSSLLPPAIEDGFLRDALLQVFDDPDDHEWLESLSRADWDELFERLELDGPTAEPLARHIRGELFAALRLVSVRLAAFGSDPTLVRYLPALAKHESPFLAQEDEVQDLVVRLGGPPPRAPDDRHLDVLIEQCHTCIAQVRKRSHEAGVDVNLVFMLARIEQLAERLIALRDLLDPPPGTTAEEQRGQRISFFTKLVRSESRRHSLGDLFSGTFELIARRVTEHASKSGEHYVSSSREQFFRMYRAASGAGLIVAAMALNKILLGRLDMPLVWAAIAFSLNYGMGFVIIHVLGFTIATKQPAMTAATLAATLDPNDRREDRVEALTELAAEVSRTQWISIAGNVSVGFVTAIAIALAVGALGVEPVSVEKGDQLLHELHPFRSLALLHAAIAGVYLFLSGLISGYFDNLSLYHRVPDRLRRVRWMRRLLGATRVQKVAGYVEHNLGALVGNFLFGCMLGSTGTIGKLLGLPIDIRHVSFAAANLGYGIEASNFQVLWTVVVNSAFGVACIGLVNLLVSFALALRVALRSRGIDASQTRGLFTSVARRFMIGPREFFLPPRTPRAKPPDAR
jgi:site-specific recombinase